LEIDLLRPVVTPVCDSKWRGERSGTFNALSGGPGPEPGPWPLEFGVGSGVYKIRPELGAEEDFPLIDPTFDLASSISGVPIIIWGSGVPGPGIIVI